MENLKELLKIFGGMLYFLIVCVPLSLLLLMFAMTAYELKHKVTQWQK